MKIRLAILEEDTAYLNRMVAAFNVKYADKLEMYSFTNLETAMVALEKSRIDVFLANETFEIVKKDIPDKCGFAYLVEAKDIESVRNEKVICKFQKADMIYKQIISIFAEISSDVIGINANDGESGKVIAFMSPAGGAGSSTAAAACAMNFASKGKKTFYLNLEHLGSADVFFKGEGQGNFGDIIYAIKSKKGNVLLKIEGTVKVDASGVNFFSTTPLALDIAELRVDEIKQLIKDIRVAGDYDYIILDLDFSMDKSAMEFLKFCNAIVFVTDGSAIANTKMERMMDSLVIVEQQLDTKIVMKSGVLYNRFSSQTSSKIELEGVREIGGIKRYEGFGTSQILEQLSKLDVFDALA